MALRFQSCALSFYLIVKRVFLIIYAFLHDRKILEIEGADYFDVSCFSLSWYEMK